MTYHSGYTWNAESSDGQDDLDGAVKQLTAASTANANLWIYMAKDPNFFGVIGVAWVGTMCKGWAKPNGYTASINEKRSNALTSAEVVTHEMGHNMGMSCKVSCLNLKISLFLHFMI